MRRNLARDAVLFAVSLLELAMPGDCPDFRGAQGIPDGQRSIAAKMGLSPSVAMAAQPAGSRTGALHKAMAGQNHAEARKLAEAMVKSANQGERVAASLAYGRVLLSQGERDAARQYLAFMGKQNLDANAVQLMQVYAAWLAALDAEKGSGAFSRYGPEGASQKRLLTPFPAREAIQSLEQMLADRPDAAATAEAADVLAQLYLARGDRAAAKKAVDFGLGFLKYQDIKHPYLDRLLKSRLAVRADEEHPEARKLYEQAEKLRGEGKPAEAGKRFAELRARYPQTVWADAAGYRMGQCLLALGRAEQAEQHWTAFADQQPGGPWRGQARAALAEWALAGRGDLKAAGQHVRAARTILAQGVDEAAAPSWQNAAADVHLLHGVIALLEARHADAAAALREARAAAGQQPPARFLAGLDRLITAAERREPLLPADTGPISRNGPKGAAHQSAPSRASPSPDEKLRAALSLGVVYHLLGRFEQAAVVFDHVLSGPVRIAHQPHRSFAALGKGRALVSLKVAGTLRVPSASRTVAGPRRVPSAPLPPGEGSGVRASTPALDAPKAAFLLSLSSVPDAPWHDEALHGLALVIEDLAAATVAGTRRVPPSVSPTVAGTLRVPSSTRPPGEGPGVRAYADGIPQTTPAQARAALEAARAEALPHWQALLDRFPESLHVPQALYHAGVLYAEGAKPDPERSAAAFEQLTNKFPASPWAGDAHVRLIDVKLERQFDLPAAALHARAAADWLATVAGTRRVPSNISPLPPGEGSGVRASTDGPSADVPPNISPLPPGEGPGVRASAGGTHRASSTTADGTAERACYFADPTPPALPALRRTTYDIYLRAGLIAYLSERPTEAVEWFERAKPFEPERNFVVVHGEIPTGIERLITAARSGKSLTPEEARQGDERARLILMLADVYHEGEQWEKSIELCTAAITDKSRSITPVQRSWAHFRRGRDYYCLDGAEFNPDAAFADYAAAVRTAPNAPWADTAMFLAANILWNERRDADGAIALWKRVVATYPDGCEVERSAYFIGLAYRASKRPRQAIHAFEQFITKYPGSRFATSARREAEKLKEHDAPPKPVREERP